MGGADYSMQLPIVDVSSSPLGVNSQTIYDVLGPWWIVVTWWCPVHSSQRHDIAADPQRRARIKFDADRRHYKSLSKQGL